MQCSRLAFVCIYIYICIYPSHFNCVGAVSVVSFPYYVPRGIGPTRRRSTCEKDRARAEMEQERSKCDRARERKRKQRDTASEESKAKEKE